MDALSAEDAFLAGVLGVPPLPPEAQRRLAASIAWDRLLALASPNLHPTLADRIEPTLPPPEARHRLEAARRAAGVTALARRVALREALAALDVAGCPVIVLKGAALAELVYREPWLRPMEDLDLWVRPEDAARAAQALVRGSYQPAAHSPVAIGLAPRIGPPSLLRHGPTTVEVELHTDPVSLAGLSRARRERMWAQARSMPLAGAPASVLAPDDLLLHLGLHAAALHGFSAGWRSLLDVSLVLERWRGDWDWIAMQDDWAREGVGTWMRTTLWLGHALLGAPVPEAVLDPVRRAPSLREVEALAIEQLGHPGPLVPTLWRALFLPRRWRDRARRLRGLFRARYRGEPEKSTPRRPGTAALRGLLHDAIVKLPRDVRAWWRGDLRGERLRSRLGLADRRARLQQLVLGLEPADRGPQRSSVDA